MKRPLALLSAALLAGVAVAQADPAVVSKLLDEGKNRNQVMKHLWYLTKRIGHRLTSSPQLDKAYKWTTQKFKEFGCDEAFLEQWGEYPVGFDRGRKQWGRMTAPERIEFEFTTPSWAPGTRGPARGPAILEPTTMEEFEKVKDRLKGAWVVSKRAAGRGGATPPQEVADAIRAAGIHGTVFGSRNDLVITSGNHRIAWDALPKDVRVTVRKKDFDAILERLDKNENVQLEFMLENKFVKGPIPNYNVIAEIKGTEKPDEVVIVSGHLDSWDGPGSEGAMDNGTGIAVTMEAARILCKVGAKPKRTIRFILWTGEEQGLFGSRAYVEKHKDDLSKISCVFVDDGGTNYQGGLTCTKEMEPMLREALEPAMNAFPDLPMQIRIADRIPRGGGSDHAPFNAAGVPGFFWFETGRADYTFAHHTQNDKYELAIPEYLIQSATNTACAAYILACAPTLLPREAPQPPPSSGGGSAR
jgi:hypothetical protein